MNFAREVLQAQPPERRALVELQRDGTRREWSFGEMRQLIEVVAATLHARGVRRGDVVMTLIGNRVEWVATMMSCFRIGAVVLPCTEQLRAKDLRLRLDVTQPKLIVADKRNRAELQAATPPCQILWIPDDASLFAQQGPPLSANEELKDNDPAVCHPALCPELKDDDPALITFTSGTAGEPKAVLHGQRYLHGQRTQAEAWLGAQPDQLVWCTAGSGWSKSARNVFMAPWLTGAAALLHDARFDPHERLELIEQEQVNVLCMAPTEYRVIAKRAQLRELPSLTQMVAAGEALNPEVLHAWREATRLDVRDGYGQTETGQMTAMPIGQPARPGSMGRALQGVKLTVTDGELTADPRTVPTFFLGYLGEGVRRGQDGEWQVEDRREQGPWHTGDRVSQDDDGYLRFEGRADDVIVSAGYRIGPFEVESALVAHPAVAEAAAVAASDDERGSVVRAVVVLRDGHSPSPKLARELQDHVKRETAPYKYPRIVEFATELPKTASGKVRRALLRQARR
ncbi:MAG TPA: AMP-binding protein [Solirubrobacteraceae bacterium]|nr:AMP-binding protein [Solirubrobacteraceae bacterium]